MDPKLMQEVIEIRRNAPLLHHPQWVAAQVIATATLDQQVAYQLTNENAAEIVAGTIVGGVLRRVRFAQANA